MYALQGFRAGVLNAPQKRYYVSKLRDALTMAGIASCLDDSCALVSDAFEIVVRLAKPPPQGGRGILLETPIMRVRLQLLQLWLH